MAGESVSLDHLPVASACYLKDEIVRVVSLEAPRSPVRLRAGPLARTLTMRAMAAGPMVVKKLRKCLNFGRVLRTLGLPCRR